MKTGHKLILVASLGIGLLCVTIQAEDKPTPAGASNVGLTNQTEKVSYGIGMGWGTQLKRSGFEVNVDTLASAIRDVLADKPLKMTEQQARETIVAYQHDLQAQRVRKTARKGKLSWPKTRRRQTSKPTSLPLLMARQPSCSIKLSLKALGKSRRAMMSLPSTTEERSSMAKNSTVLPGVANRPNSRSTA